LARVRCIILEREQQAEWIANLGAYER